jgi:ABC-type transport system substrate-binding protein
MEYEDSVRYGLYKQMENIIIDDCPVIVLYYDEVLRLYHNNITGMETNPMNVLKLEKVDKAL